MTAMTPSMELHAHPNQLGPCHTNPPIKFFLLLDFPFRQTARTHQRWHRHAPCTVLRDSCFHALAAISIISMHRLQAAALSLLSSFKDFISLGLLSVTLFNLGNLHRPINIRAKIKLFGLLIASLAFAGCIAEETVDLGDANFDSTLESFETALVMFYAPW